MSQSKTGGRRYFPDDRSRLIRQVIMDKGEPLTAYQIRVHLVEKYGVRWWQTDISAAGIAAHIRRHMRGGIVTTRRHGGCVYALRTGVPDCYGSFGSCKSGVNGSGRCGYLNRCAAVARLERGICR